MAQQLAYITGNPKLQSTGDLAIMVFYYLLISREYIKSQKLKKRKIGESNKDTTFQCSICGFLKKMAEFFLGTTHWT